jgi:uncharacterized protein (TIGR02285 family)
MQFSNTPAIIMPPHGITVKRSKLPLFDNKKVVSLEELLKNDKLRLGIAEGRSYGKDLDALLKKHEGQKHVYARAGKELYKGLFQMLMADRIDYLLGYPMEAMYFAGEFGVSNQIVNIALKESDEYRLTYVGCSKTEWGKQVIDRIDEILKKERTTDQYRAFHERWLDENSLEVFREAYSDIFLSTGK